MAALGCIDGAFSPACFARLALDFPRPTRADASPAETLRGNDIVLGVGCLFVGVNYENSSMG